MTSPKEARIDITASEHGGGPLEDVSLEATMKVTTFREEGAASY